MSTSPSRSGQTTGANSNVGSMNKIEPWTFCREWCNSRIKDVMPQMMYGNSLDVALEMTVPSFTNIQSAHVVLGININSSRLNRKIFRRFFNNRKGAFIGVFSCLDKYNFIALRSSSLPSLVLSHFSFTRPQVTTSVSTTSSMTNQINEWDICNCSLSLCSGHFNFSIGSQNQLFYVLVSWTVVPIIEAIH